MRRPVLAALVILLATSLTAQGQSDPVDHMTWWREARFGLFIHWGPVSLKGTEIGWSRGGERRGTGGTGDIPLEVYDNLYREFNPVEFDAREWVQIALNAGMKYLVFTSKHHDGFCMFDSALTEYKITNSPFQRDVVRELADACHEAGLKVGWYYSPPDWHHPDYRTANHARYIEYLHGQLRELCTNYGKIDILWFDGLGGTAEDWDAEKLVTMIRELQPGIVINDRAGLPEDHATPEQRVGAFNRNRRWETCMTICNQWAWKPDDTMKTLDKCIDVLVRTAGGDGNLLFNVGPMPDGRIEPRQVDRLAEMGAWLGQFGETIYGTRGGPYMPSAWGASTCKNSRVYLHVLDWNQVKDGRIELPPLPRAIIRHELLTGGAVKLENTPEALILHFDASARVEPDTILALEVEGNAEDLSPIPLPTEIVQGNFAASNVYESMDMYSPAMAFDGNPETRWATDSGTHQAWLQIRFNEPRKISQILVSEACGDRIQKFELQQSDDGKHWTTFYTGEKLGMNGRARFEAITTSGVRLKILEATEGPTLWEVQFSEKQDNAE
ncbi:MAG TPA: alpha-L-fucosidase [Candidatus Hydrogenedentes bacterium]|nr:alpha-L-fucosidase [Candidatus Hydrogenedentota bacterium]